LLKDGRVVSRPEYDDGAAYIDGKLVDIRKGTKLRVRYIMSYNFLIAAYGSSINNNDFGRRLEELLRGMLRKKNTLEELAAKIAKLPRQD